MSKEKPSISELLDFAIQHKASDLHLSSGLSPMFRIDGDLRPADYAVLEHADIITMIDTIMNDRQRAQYKEKLETDLSFENEAARFRVNVFTQERGAAAVFRIIPTAILTMQDLGPVIN